METTSLINVGWKWGDPLPVIPEINWPTDGRVPDLASLPRLSDVQMLFHAAKYLDAPEHERTGALFEMYWRHTEPFIVTALRFTRLPTFTTIRTGELDDAPRERQIETYVKSSLEVLFLVSSPAELPTIGDTAEPSFVVDRRLALTPGRSTIGQLREVEALQPIHGELREFAATLYPIS